MKLIMTNLNDRNKPFSGKTAPAQFDPKEKQGRIKDGGLHVEASLPVGADKLTNQKNTPPSAQKT
jgi:hypothetical protein